jgi:hypothetical protein
MTTGDPPNPDQLAAWVRKAARSGIDLAALHEAAEAAAEAQASLEAEPGPELEI